MKRIAALLLTVLLLVPVFAFAAPLDLAGATKEDLLEWRQQIDDALRLNGWFPFAEITSKSDSEHIVRLQNRLAELGYYTKEITGKFDKNTTSAFAAFAKANGFKAGKTVTIANQELLFADTAAALPTPTPGPTPIPDGAAFQLTKVTLFSRYDYLKFRVEGKNLSKTYTIDAFNLVARAYNRYGQSLGWYNTILDKEHGFTTQTCKIAPGKKFSMGSGYWDLFGWDTAVRIEVAVTKYHTTDGKTVEIPRSEYVWVEGNLK